MLTPVSGDLPRPDSIARPQTRPVARTWRLMALLVLYVIVGHLLPAPPGVDAAGQRITAIFLATIAGLMIQPLPGAAVVVLGITMLVIAGGLPLKDALAGYSSAPRGSCSARC